MSEPARVADPEPRRVRVTVAGQEFHLRTDQDETLAAQAAELVTRELGRAKSGRLAPSGNEALILAALNLAGEVIQLRSERELLSQEVTGRLDRLIEKLQQASQEPGS